MPSAKFPNKRTDLLLKQIVQTKCKSTHKRGNNVGTRKQVKTGTHCRTSGYLRASNIVKKLIEATGTFRYLSKKRHDTGNRVWSSIKGEKKARLIDNQIVGRDGNKLIRRYERDGPTSEHFGAPPVLRRSSRLAAKKK